MMKVIYTNAPGGRPQISANQSAYYGPYELKTNKSENDYFELIQFIYTLNNISNADFPASLRTILKWICT